MTSKFDIARLKVKMDDVEPAVVRWLDVPVGMRLGLPCECALIDQLDSARPQFHRNENAVDSDTLAFKVRQDITDILHRYSLRRRSRSCPRWAARRFEALITQRSAR